MPNKNKEKNNTVFKVEKTAESIEEMFVKLGLDMSSLPNNPGQKMRFWNFSLEGEHFGLEPSFKEDKMDYKFSNPEPDGNLYDGVDSARDYLHALIQNTPLMVYTSEKDGVPTKPYILMMNTDTEEVEAYPVEPKVKGFWGRLAEKIINFFSSKEAITQRKLEKQATEAVSKELQESVGSCLSIMSGFDKNVLNSQNEKLVVGTGNLVKEMNTLSRIKNETSNVNSKERVTASIMLDLVKKHPQHVAANLDNFKTISRTIFKSKKVDELSKLPKNSFMETVENAREMDMIEKDIFKELNLKVGGAGKGQKQNAVYNDKNALGADPNEAKPEKTAIVPKLNV